MNISREPVRQVTIFTPEGATQTTLSRVEAYTWNHPDGQEITWNITRARDLIGNRPPDFPVVLANMRELLANNPNAPEFNREYAMTTDLTKPLFVVLMFEGQTAHLVLIDGWHRVMKAVATNTAQLPVCVLRPNEDMACRCRFEPALNAMVPLHP